MCRCVSRCVCVWVVMVVMSKCWESLGSENFNACSSKVNNKMDRIC